jgi:catechol 2,3-dioxygenase-like lactoylglutathione lyase family enzyme
MLDSIDHINLVVRDLPQMIQFYESLLGLKLTRRVMISGDWIERVVGLKDVVAEVVYLDLASGPRIELICYQHPTGERPAGVGVANAQGIGHIAFRVEDINAIVARLTEAGVSFLSEVQNVPNAQVTYSGGVRKRLVYFRDPEGNLLELCEYKSVAPS